MEQFKNRYEFGPFCLDMDERVLLREGRLVPLAPKALNTLFVLVRSRGHVVEKDVLMNEVWPDEDVEEGNLAQHIFMLRRVLGEIPDGPKYIETVPRRGYRFLRAVREINDAAVSATFDPTSRLAGPPTDGRVAQPNHLLAVLPFFNVSENPATEHVSDRITESIINSLSQVPRLRVMSHSAVFRFKGKKLDAQRVGTELGVDTVLVGTFNTTNRRLLISAELVDVANGWQLWGENFDRDAEAILAVQAEIARQVSATLRSRLGGNEEQRHTKRFTENTEAYQSYLQGRRSWSKHTREGTLQAIVHFQRALELDSGYALAYAAIVDSYLRLATNYFPPADTLAKPPLHETNAGSAEYSAAKVKLRCEWDLKAMESELRHARELRTGYPAAHQWHAAHLFSLNLYQESLTTQDRDPVASGGRGSSFESVVPHQFQSASLTPAEQVQVFCIIAREQINVANYDAACAVLKPWWTFGHWPRLEGLGLTSCADLLLTVGALAGNVASTEPTPKSAKHAENLLNGAIALGEQLGSATLAAAGRIELGSCYYRQGIFDLALSLTLEALPDKDCELRTVGLIKLGGFECYSGHLRDSLKRLNEAAEIVALVGPSATARFHLEYASALKELGAAESRTDYFDEALKHYQQAFYEYETIGNYRYAAIVENNHGYLLLRMKRYDEAGTHLMCSRKLLVALDDQVRRAQIDDTLARLHIAVERFDLAEQAIAQAVESLAFCGREALFAEALTTRGVVLCKLGRYREAKRTLDRAYMVAERCGDSEGAGGALLILIEEMFEHLENEERLEIGAQLYRLLARSQKASTLKRLRKCLKLISTAHASKPTRKRRGPPQYVNSKG